MIHSNNKNILLTVAVALLTLTLNLSLMTAGQTPVTVNAHTVSVLFSVTDKQGNPIKGLNMSDVRITEDGKAQKSTDLVEVSDLPLSIVLMVDRSGSNNRDLLQNLLSKSMDFFQSNLRLKDRVALLSFGVATHLGQDFTNDPRTLASAINRDLGPLYGPTSLHDSLLKASRLLTRKTDRKVIFLITDGEDNNSRSTFEEMLEELQKNNVSVFCFHTPQPPTLFHPARDPDNLRRLSSETGGILSDGRILGAEFDKIRSLLISQYAVSYVPENTSRKPFHQIRIQTSVKDAKITTRSGYYR